MSYPKIAHNDSGRWKRWSVPYTSDSAESRPSRQSLALLRIAQRRTTAFNQKFARTNLDRLTKEFVDQLCQDTGGQCTYTGLNMRQAHTNMGVTSGEFDAFMQDLVATLNDFNVGKAEQDELLNNLRPMRAEIVEVESPQVATSLPSAFTPAPPL